MAEELKACPECGRQPEPNSQFCSQRCFDLAVAKQQRNTRTPATHPLVGEVREALQLFVRSAYPVSTKINPRGYNWSEAYLDGALENARALLEQLSGEGG